jgi:hypothetical protein
MCCHPPWVDWCLQIFFVWWIGVNRFRENRHNISDIVAGWFMVRRGPRFLLSQPCSLLSQPCSLLS